jgi:hypothetical protein
MTNHIRETLDNAFNSTKLMGYIFLATVPIYVITAHIIAMGWFPVGTFLVNPRERTYLVLRLIFLGCAAVSMLGVKPIARLVNYRASKESPLTARINAWFIAFALCDIVAVLGLGLFLLAGNLLDMYIFAILSLASFYVYFPRRTHWEAAVRGAGLDVST